MSQVIIQLEKGAKQTGVDGKNIYSAIASTAAIDRDGEVLLPKGCDPEHYKKNPVMLFIHNYKQVPVGKVESLEITNEAVKFTFSFNDTPDGKMLDGMYSRGEMNAFSVGFAPIKYAWIDETTPTLLSVEYPDKSTDVIDLSKYSKLPSRIFTHWELLEISPVPVPANPEALILRAKEDMIRKAYELIANNGAKQLAVDKIEHETSQALTLIKEFLKSAEEKDSYLDLNAISYEKNEKVLDSDWDSLKSKASFFKLATQIIDEKEVISWNVYAKGFAFVDSSKADCVSSYKFPHHEVLDSEICLNEKGVYQAMALLLSDKESVGKDLEAVYSHLKAHYEDMDKIAPELKDYSEDEIKQIEQKGVLEIEINITGSTITSNENETESESEPPSAEQPPAIVEMMRSLDEKFLEFTELFGLKFRILSDTLDSIHSSIKELKAVEVKHDPIIEEKVEDAIDEEVEKQMNLLKEFLGEKLA